MFTQETIDEVRRQLREDGKAIVPTAHDRRVFLIPLSWTSELIVAYENGGCFVYNFDRPVNEFRLIKAGFTVTVAKAVSQLLTALTQGWADNKAQALLTSSQKDS